MFSSPDIQALGTLSVATGGSLTAGNSLAVSGTLEVDQLDDSFQPISVSNRATLGGTLRVNFPPAPSLSVGDTWDLIDAGSVVGKFNSITSNFSGAYNGFATSVASGGANGNLVRLSYEQVLALSVNRSTGVVTMRNVSGGSPVEMDGYSIGSVLGSLAVGAFDSLENQGIGDFLVGNLSNDKLTELRPSGSFTITGGATPLNLGNIYQPTPSQFQQHFEELVFDHTRPDGVTLRGVVEYEGFGKNDLVLQVNPADGSGTLVNESPFTIHIDGYSITSELGQLQMAGWTGLGGDWVKSLSSNLNRLSELNPLDATTLTPGARLELGSIVDVTAAGGVGLPDADLKLEFLLAESGALDGDYNDDGLVNAADYVAWRDNLGAEAGTLPKGWTTNNFRNSWKGQKLNRGEET